MAVGPSLSEPAGIIVRPELVARLERAPADGVILVGAPAGSGKTVLIRSWLRASHRTAAWVSVERAESDPQHFWSSVVEAIRTAVGSEAVGRLAPTPRFDGDAAVKRLRSELGALEHPVVLVIDDLHELASTGALRQLEDFLAPPAPSLRAVLAFRGEIRLRLHRLRLAGALTELHARDLVFTLQQTRELLAASGIELSDTALRALHDRTEGWAAGVRLAALSLAGHPEPERFVAEFSGTERTVADYLLSEVLERQPPEVRRLLLRTSVLERVSGPLADALTGGVGSEQTLQALEDGGAFVVALDGGRTWFRYHHLFADLLRLQLRRTAPEDVVRLHAAAASWFAAHDHVVEAVAHAQAAGDWSQAVDLMAHRYFSLELDGRQATARSLLQSFPRDEMSADPELALVLAADELSVGSLDASAAHVALAVRHAAAVPAQRRRRFDAGLALVRLSLAARRGDFESVLDLAQTLDVSEQPEMWLDITMHNDLRVLALMNLGIVEAWFGRSADGARHLEQAREMARSIGRPYLEVGCLAHWSSTVTRSSFLRAEATCHDAIELAEQHGWGEDPVIAPALVTLAACLAQTGRFEEAERWLERAERTLRPEVEPAVGFLLCGVREAVDLARGRVEDVVASYERAERLRELMVSPPRLADQFRSAALRARVRSGQLPEVRRAVAGLSEQERERGEFREVLAELALAEREPHQALEALAPILDGSAPVHHVCVVIRALLLGAVIRDDLGEANAAKAAVERALDLAASDRLVMPFAHTPSREHLARHPHHQTAHGAFLSDILDVLTGGTPDPLRSDPAPLQEPLTDVELRVLRFLPSNLTAREIAGELYLSANTVKTHMRHIYAKLDAHTRAQALERARALGLLAERRGSR